MRPGSAVSFGEVPPDVAKWWLMDTGCGHDLVGQKAIKDYSRYCRPVKKSVTFNTAGGPSPTKQVISITVEELSQASEPCVLKSTPSVLSIGERCMDRGCGFHWSPGVRPY